MKIYKKQKMLITGGNGYIGSCLAKIASNKYDVFIIDKKKRNIFLKQKKISFFRENLNNLSKIKKIFFKIKPNIVVHLAGQSTIDFINKKKKSYLNNNINVTQNIIKLCKIYKIQKLIFSSTASVYKEGKKPFKENSKLKPNNLYGKTKLKNEEDIQKSLKKACTKYCILRFFNVCSSLAKEKVGEFHSPETHLIPKVVNHLFMKKKIFIYGNDYNTKDSTAIRDFIHIRDILNGILRAINFLDKNKSEIFNLGSASKISVMEIINKSSQLLEIKPLIKIKKRRTGDLPTLTCNIQKSKKKLKWYPKNSTLKKIIIDEIKWQKYLRQKKYKRMFYN